MIEIFEDDDSADLILSRALEHGIAGIAGGRVSTRNKLKEVSALAKRLHHSDIHASSSVFHFWGELALVYDTGVYEYQEAIGKLVAAYDGFLAEQGIFPDSYWGS